MRGDIPEAAFRLSCALPVTTHERDKPRPKYVKDALRDYRKRGLTDGGIDGKRKHRRNDA